MKIKSVYGNQWLEEEALYKKQHKVKQHTGLSRQALHTALCTRAIK